MVWGAIAVTVVASSAAAVGKQLQKEATRSLPRLQWDGRVLREYARSRRWVAGLAVDGLSGIGMLYAYANAPVSLVQPLSCVGLAGLALYAHAVGGDRLGAREWVGVSLALLGTVALGAGARDLEARAAPPSARRALAGLFLATLAALAVARPPRRAPSGRRSTARLGLASGVCLGLSANLSRCGLLLAARPRRIRGLAVPVPGRAHPLESACWGAAGVAGAAVAAAVALALQTAGLKRGSAVVVCTCASAAGTLFGAAVGKIALGEPLFAGDPVTASLAWLLIGLAVLSLADAGGGAGLPQVGGALANAKRHPIPVVHASPPRERRHSLKRGTA